MSAQREALLEALKGQALRHRDGVPIGTATAMAVLASLSARGWTFVRYGGLRDVPDTEHLEDCSTMGDWDSRSERGEPPCDCRPGVPCPECFGTPCQRCLGAGRVVHP